MVSTLQFIENLRSQLTQADNKAENIAVVITELKAYYKYIRKSKSTDLKRLNIYFDEIINNLSNLSNVQAGQAKELYIQQIETDLLNLMNKIVNLSDSATQEIHKIESKITLSPEGLIIEQSGTGIFAIITISISVLFISIFYIFFIKPGIPNDSPKHSITKNLTWNDSIDTLTAQCEKKLKIYSRENDSIDSIIKKTNNQQLINRRSVLKYKIDTLKYIILPDINVIRDYQNEITKKRINQYFKNLDK